MSTIGTGHRTSLRGGDALRLLISLFFGMTADRGEGGGGCADTRTHARHTQTHGRAEKLKLRNGGW